MSTHKKFGNPSNSQKFTATLIILMVGNDAVNAGTISAQSWSLFARDASNVFKSCQKNEFTSLYYLLACLKRSSLELFDRVISNDVIPITNTVRLVRYKKNTSNGTMKTEKTESNRAFQKSIFDGSDIDTSAWINHIAKHFLDVLSTHAIHVDLTQITEGRARHRRNQMLPIMVFGMTALGMIMVPIGFQLLAALGGKALLLSKMALLLASINGLKRVATSGVHYGLYHTDPHYQHGPWERSDQFYNRPRNLKTNVLGSV